MTENEFYQRALLMIASNSAFGNGRQRPDAVDHCPPDDGHPGTVCTQSPGRHGCGDPHQRDRGNRG